VKSKNFLFYSFLISGTVTADVIDLRAKTSCIKLVRAFHIHRNLFPLAVDIERGFPRESFEIYKREWDDIFNFSKWEKILARLEEKSDLRVGQFNRVNDLKHIGSQLRHHFELFTAGHEIPDEFQQLIKKFGQLRDRIKADKTKKARKAARKIEKLLADYNPSQELAHFKPTSPSNIQRYIREQNAYHAALMKAEGMTVYEFHKVKKYVRSLKMLLIMQTEIYDDEALEVTLKLVRKIYRKMDKVNDKMTMRKVKDGMLYKDTELLLDPAFVKLIKNILI